MKNGCDRLRAGAAVALPSGDTLQIVERTVTHVWSGPRWGWAAVQHAPHALVLRRADGTLSVLAVSAEPVSRSLLEDVVSKPFGEAP